MKPLLQLIFSLIFISSVCQLTYAQDSTVVKVNSGPSIYIDYGKLLTIPTDFETKFEAGIAFRLKNKFSPNIQIGMAKLEPTGAINNGSYYSEGWYGRIGINYLMPINATSLLYVGAKYGMSSFDEGGSYEIGSNLWDHYTDTFSRTGMQADWFEIIVGSEKILSDHWALGGYFSFRVLNERDKFSPIDTYAIPGYGRAFDNTTPAANFYIRFSL